MRFEYSREKSPPCLIMPVSVSKIERATRLEINSLIDTGADISAIPEGMVKKLKLLPGGEIDIYGVFGKRECPTYFISIYVNKAYFDIEVISYPGEHFIMGRDLLNQFLLIADGPKEIFELK